MRSFENPIIRGFYPDPSACLVGEDVYLATSTFHYFPGVPIFKSRDLTNWEQIGHCLTRPSQLPLERCGSSKGIFAPTLRYHNGRFYMITTNISGGGHFYVYSDDPASEWSEPIWIEGIGGIDPSLFFDEDGKVYFTWAAGKIFQAEINIETGKLLTEPREVWQGTGGQHTEAPHLYKIDRMYYILLAEGGTSYGHMITIARSQSPWGTWEVCPNNPVLSNRSLDIPLQATGHGDLFKDSAGIWWMVFLGVRPDMGHPRCYHLGRETCLVPVEWKGGWPVAGDKGKAHLSINASLPEKHPCQLEPLCDDFDNSQLYMYWNFLRNPHDADWSLQKRPGWLALSGSSVTLDDEDSPAWVGRRQQHHNCCAETLLDFEPQDENEEAGLCVIQNEKHHYEIALRRTAKGREVFVRRRVGSLVAESAQAFVGAGAVKLLIRATEQEYSFLFEASGNVETELAKGEVRYLTTEVAQGFVGTYFGLYATGNGKPAQSTAYFDYFNYIIYA